MCENAWVVCFGCVFFVLRFFLGCYSGRLDIKALEQSERKQKGTLLISKIRSVPSRCSSESLDIKDLERKVAKRKKT